MKHQRVKEIESYLMQNESVSLDALCEAFNVSKVTIRRDLSELEALGIVKKVYGGVVLSSKAENLVPFFTRQEDRAPQKLRIGRKAAEMVEAGDIIIIDAGSTTVSMVRFIDPGLRITVVTNSLSVMNEVAAHRKFRLITVGGEYLRETNSMVGIEAIQAFGKLNAQKAFLGATGISLDKGITNSSSIEAEIKRAIIKVSDRRILLADSNKFDKASLVTFAELSQIDVVISDDEPPQGYYDAARRTGVELISAP
jgi:DeoR family myo-inositol catabolism operon transcriptional repressor